MTNDRNMTEYQGFPVDQRVLDLVAANSDKVELMVDRILPFPFIPQELLLVGKVRNEQGQLPATVLTIEGQFEEGNYDHQEHVVDFIARLASVNA